MNYEQGQTRLHEIKNAIEALQNQIPVSKSRDKCGLRFAGSKDYDTPGISGDSWRSASIHFGASHGYYGSSAAYDDMSKDVARYVLLALRHLEPSIIQCAVNIAESERKSVAVKMADEARKIVELASLEQFQAVNDK